jgi:hypothetical protein
MHKFSKMDPLRIWYEETSATEFIESLPEGLQKRVKKRIEKTAANSGSEFDLPKLTGSVGGGIRITDQPPLIFHSEITSTADATILLDELFRNYRASLPDDRRILLDRYRLVDAAI